jgi:hypothetical protein
MVLEILLCPSVATYHTKVHRPQGAKQRRCVLKRMELEASLKKIFPTIAYIKLEVDDLVFFES